MSPLQNHLSSLTSLLHLVVQPESSCCLWDVGQSKSINSEKGPKKQLDSRYPFFTQSQLYFSCKILERKEGACHWKIILEILPQDSQSSIQ